MPHPGKRRIVGITCCRSVSRGRSVERNRRPASISRCRCRERNVVYFECGTDVEHIFPGLSFVLRHRHASAGAEIRKGEIDTPGRVGGDSRIIALANNGGFRGIGAGVHRPNRPGHAVVLRQDERLGTTAVAIRQVNGSIGGDFRVPMQATALGRDVHRNRRPIRQSTIVTSRAERCFQILRAIVDRVGVGR